MNRQALLSALILSEKEYGVVATLHHFYGSSIQVNLPFSTAVCAASIDELQLSVRSWNALKRAGISTISELIDLIACDGLPKVRNLGRKSNAEIKTRLMAYGFDQLSEAARIRFFEQVIDRNLLGSSESEGW